MQISTKENLKLFNEYFIFSGCGIGMFSCGIQSEDSESSCIPLEKRCDNFNDCVNGRDELECSLITNLVTNNLVISIIAYIIIYLKETLKECVF